MSRDVIMPALGMAQRTGLIVRWLKRPGDQVKKGDISMEVETDKAVMEVEADADGTLTDVSAGGRRRGVPVGEMIARIADGAVAAAAPAARAPAAPPPVKSAAPEGALDRRSGSSATSGSGAFACQERTHIRLPRARRLAAEQGLDLAKLAKAGSHNLIWLGIWPSSGRCLPNPLAAQPRGESSAPPLRLTATLAKDGLADFCAWRRAETGARRRRSPSWPAWRPPRSGRALRTRRSSSPPRLLAGRSASLILIASVSAAPTSRVAGRAGARAAGFARLGNN